MILFPRQASLPCAFSIYRDNTKINPYYYSKNRGQNSAIRSKFLIAHANRHHTMNGSGLREYGTLFVYSFIANFSFKSSGWRTLLTILPFFSYYCFQARTRPRRLASRMAGRWRGLHPSTIFRGYPCEIRCALTFVNFTGQAGRASVQSWLGWAYAVGLTPLTSPPFPKVL